TREIFVQSVPARSKRVTLVLPAGNSLKSRTVMRSTTPESLNRAISYDALVRSEPRPLLTTNVSRQPLSDGWAALSSSESMAACSGAGSCARAGDAIMQAQASIAIGKRAGRFTVVITFLAVQYKVGQHAGRISPDTGLEPKT